MGEGTEEVTIHELLQRHHKALQNHHEHIEELEEVVDTAVSNIRELNEVVETTMRDVVGEVDERLVALTEATEANTELLQLTSSDASVLSAKLIDKIGELEERIERLEARLDKKDEAASNALVDPSELTVARAYELLRKDDKDG